MDVLVLIDKLDDTVHNAKPVPLTDQVRVDKEEIYDILDQMRATIPEEIKQARWIVKERQEMLAEAKREAERVVKEARDEQTRLIGDEEVVKQAERQADDIVEDAARASARSASAPRTTPTTPQHPRGQPDQVHRGRAARPRPATRPRRGGSRLGRALRRIRRRGRPGLAEPRAPLVREHALVRSAQLGIGADPPLSGFWSASISSSSTRSPSIAIAVPGQAVSR